MCAALTGAGSPEKDAVFRRFERRVTVERAGLTYVIDVSFKSESAEKAARIANAFAGQYIANQGINLTGKQVKIDFTASRGSDGLTADVDITAIGETHVKGQAITREVTVSADPVVQTAEPVQEEQASETPAEEAEAKEVAPASSLFS